MSSLRRIWQQRDWAKTNNQNPPPLFWLLFLLALLAGQMLACGGGGSSSELILYVDGKEVARISGISCKDGQDWEFTGINLGPGDKVEAVGIQDGEEVCREELDNPLDLTTGAEPPYEPGKWNDNDIAQKSNNCYSYAANDRDPTGHPWCKPQPGVKSGSTFADISCQAVSGAAEADGFSGADCGAACGSGQYKIALVIAPGVDYHWYRQDQGGYWSHKPGFSEATDLDASGNRIIDPRTADRDDGSLNYSEFCGCFCVPQGGIETRCP